jgi:hypothetical protein
MKKKKVKSKKKRIGKNKTRSKKIKKPKIKKPKIKKSKIRKRRTILKKKKYKNKKSIKKLKKKITKKPIDRLRSIKLPKLKLKKIKLIRFRPKKKQIFKIQKKIRQATEASFQKVINFILTPFFRAYDNYFENKKIKKLEKISFEKKEREREIIKTEKKILEDKKKELYFEKKLEKERKDDLKKFIQEGQAQLRKELQVKKRKLYESMQIQRKLDMFAKREARECASLETLALKENISEYKTVQDAIERIRIKYKLIRENKIRERIASLGIEVESQDTREDLYRKEKEFNEKRLQVEIVLESFFRSAQSLVFAINRRHLPKQSDVLRTIDKRWDENLFYVRYDNEIEENWIFLVYLEDDQKTIAVEDKSDEQKNIVKKFNTNQVFAYSDFLTDRIVAHIDRAYKKKDKNNKLN